MPRLDEELEAEQSLKKMKRVVVHCEGLLDQESWSVFLLSPAGLGVVAVLSDANVTLGFEDSFLDQRVGRAVGTYSGSRRKIIGLACRSPSLHRRRSSWKARMWQKRASESMNKDFGWHLGGASARLDLPLRCDTTTRRPSRRVCDWWIAFFTLRHSPDSHKVVYAVGRGRSHLT